MNNDYHFSLFKPDSDYTRRVRNIVLSILIMWAVAVFGFQILLKVVEKPTPEEAYTLYETVWPEVVDGTATPADKKVLAESLSHALAKSGLKPEHRVPLTNVLNWAVFSATDSLTGSHLSSGIAAMQTNRQLLAQTKDDKVYAETKANLEMAKKEVLQLLNTIHGIAPESLQAGVIAFNLQANLTATLSEEDATMIPEIMSKYLIHNQSVLTDTKFIGFPFHYFYTAVFLLILFVLLCLIFSIRIDRLQKKFNITE